MYDQAGDCAEAFIFSKRLTGASYDTHVTYPTDFPGFCDIQRGRPCTLQHPSPGMTKFQHPELILAAAGLPSYETLIQTGILSFRHSVGDGPNWGTPSSGH